MIAVQSKNFYKPFIDAGVVPSNVRRMIIDVQAGQAVKVYYDTFGNETLLQLITPQMLMDCEQIVHVECSRPKTPEPDSESAFQ